MVVRVPDVENGLKDKEEVCAQNYDNPLPDKGLIFFLFMIMGLLFYRVAVTMETKCLGTMRYH